MNHDSQRDHEKAVALTDREILLAALAMTDQAVRDAYLKSVCREDGERRARIESLLELEQKGESAEISFAQTLMCEKGSTEDEDAAQLSQLVPYVITRDNTSPMNIKFDPSGNAALLGYLQPSDKPDSLGRLGHYEIQQVLGRGAFGIVLKALDEKLQRVVAIKVLAPEMASTSPARRRFLREARSSAAVRHEHVVNIYAVEEEPLPYLVMEYIPGQTLQQRLDGTGPLDIMTVVRIARQVAEGLAAAHAEDLIHRDIKPGNILLEEGVIERVKITDFGLARAADDASTTQSGLIAGTPMYMAPEQALGQKLDQRADLFSLGTVMYQMVCGRPPFRATGTVAVLKRVVDDEPRPISEIIPETPAWLCDIITRLHAKNPDNRFQSAVELAELLADCETKLKEKRPVQILLPPTQQPSRAPWKQMAGVSIAVLLILGLTEITGITRLRSTIGNVNTPTADTDSTASNAPDTEIADAEKPNVSRRVDGMESLTSNDSVPGLTTSRQTVVDVVPAAVMQPEPLPSTYANSIGIEFVLVPKGKSWLGGDKNKFGKLEVDLPNDFYLGKYEVTQEQWLQLMESNPSSCHDGSLDELPIETVTWNAVQEFISRLNQREQDQNWTYRLPTEVEWEYACRGGPMPDRVKSRYDFYFATPTNDIQPNQANFAEGETTSPVGIFSPNPLGLYDMHGNVHEWCADPVEGPFGRVFRAHRGGCWHFSHEVGRAATEGWFPAAGSSRHLGFRLARVPRTPQHPVAKTSGTPFSSGDIQRVSALPVRQRAAEIVDELKARNPGLDGTSRHTIESRGVTEFTFRPYDGHVPVSDLSPLKALPDLKSLYLWNVSGVTDLEVLKGMHLTGLTLGGHDIQNPVTSLEPLRGMPLVGLRLYRCQIQDLEPLRGMPLELISLDHCTKVHDLTPLEGMPLQYVSIGNTDVKDLTVLSGLSLKNLAIQKTGVTDLTPLQGMNLQMILFTPKSITTGIEVLREMTSLQQIGIDYEDYTNPADFWARYDKGEFTQ